MSCENKIYTSEANVNRFLSGTLKTDKRLTGDEIALLQKYQTIQSDPDYIFLLSCAAEAAKRLKIEQPDTSLTEFGVVLENFLRAGYWHDDDALLREQIKYASKLVEVNRRFLHLWQEEITKANERKKTLNRLSEETRQLLDQNTNLTLSMRLVAENLQLEGFTLLDPSILNTPASTALTQGVEIVAENEAGDQRIVRLYLAGGQYQTEVHLADNSGGVNCSKLARDFAIRIADLLQNISTSCGAPIIANVGNSRSTNGTHVNSPARSTHFSPTPQQVTKSRS